MFNGLLELGFKYSKGPIKRRILSLIIKKDSPNFSDARKIFKKYYGISVGKYTYGCYKTDGSIAKGTKIGAFCAIAPGVRIGGMNHPLEFVSTHPFLYYKDRGFVEFTDNGIVSDGNKSVVIGDDVWIGQNAIILPGIHVGKGAVIGAGAIVTKDIPDYSIAVGVPAKVIKKRFNDDVVEKLKSIEWAKWDDEKIKDTLQDFYDHETFISKHL